MPKVSAPPGTSTSTYDGYDDSDFEVCGDVTITNTGTQDAVITDIEDLLGGSAIDVDFGADFELPYTLEVGETLEGTYCEDVDSKIEGKNEITVTTEVDEYFADADVMWGDPDVEYFDEITVEDLSDLNGLVELGMLDAADYEVGEGEVFEYSKCFNWADYSTPGPHMYYNTATIVETLQSASAVLDVNWLEEDLTVEKTAETSYVRTHKWLIDKWVETEKGDTIGEENIPKIWLLEGYAESECATWYVDVDYDGYDDSDFEVCGDVTITNTGTQDAVITDIEDLLGGSAIDVDFGADFELPYTLEVGETLEGTYCEDVDSKIEGKNEITVTTEVDEYFADADVMWGDPDDVINETVNIKDVSDLFGEVDLGSVTAPNGDTFTYDKCFAYADYEPGSYEYDNTAEIVETGQSASAKLKVNVLEEDLTVEKTAETSYVRTHKWLIDKWVETEKGDTIGEENIPKIWLLEGYAESECATWYVDVDYDGYDDSDFEVCGDVTITNTGTQDAVITDIEDLLGGSAIDVDFGADFELPYTLEVGETLEGTYCEDVDSKIEGKNEITVTTEVDEYFADADVMWGDPDDVINETVNIKDVSDLFGEVDLGSVTAPNGDTFTYDQCFNWSDFDPGSYEYDNEATIVETGQSATAKLKINVLHEDLDVSKTAVTAFTRTHSWDIDKWVETDNGYTKDGLPKIWLWSDGSGDECATWYVDVDYLGYADSDFSVEGTVTITNTGTQDAVITDVEDLLAGAPAMVDFGVTFPYTLEVGEILEGTYAEDLDSKVDGTNDVTVTTEVDTYDASAGIMWGDPTTEFNKTVNIKDVSDLFGEVDLGSVTAPNSNTFTYDKCFAWTDYTEPGPYIYENTATIVETGQYAEATLKVNWDYWCWDDQTAWAYGGPYAKANWDYVNNEFWGWTNGPLPEGSYEWPIYAGAGQNDLSKGTIVGTLYVDYIGGCVTVRYELFEGNALGEIHLWVGYEPLPKVRQGKKMVYTNAPGQFPYGVSSFGFDKYDPSTWQTSWTWSKCGFRKPIYVSAHAVVWMQVECPNVMQY
jgi:hypothetical protein